jgi:ATP-dependent DNA helicase RecQ
MYQVFFERLLVLKSFVASPHVPWSLPHTSTPQHVLPLHKLNKQARIFTFSSRSFASVSCTMRDDDDEFGDPSFLMDVDLDTIERGAVSAGDSASASAPISDTSHKRRKLASYGAPTNANANQAALEKTLSSTFGYSKFRDGQLEVIQNLLNGNRDVAVFWATGSGKSLCYQIPALQTQKITLVISPLISLMQDQVHKLNYFMNNNSNNVATFLGSGQLDKNEESSALQGRYLLIYLTPEKLLSPGFLQQLATLHKTRREIGLVAIDESHCISEYGHDFRKEYRNVGQALRQGGPQALQQIPIMALTATALPRVQTDICQSLFLRSPFVARQSFDRTNLIIACHKKDRKLALPAAMEPLIEILKENPKQKQQKSTIIYAPTRNQVEEITSFLQQRLLQESIQVEGYHAGMSNEVRTSVHTNFLTGKTTVICATVAFGLGIDKPDIRRVIHFGPPKTVEDYYQQIGRAGRDGLKAECTLYASEAEFDKYKSDFYLGGLQGNAKEAVVASIDALKAFTLDGTKCRRRALLDFFQETPAWGQRCGTCDNCKKYNTLDSNDLERSFPMARVVLKAIQALDEPSASTVLSVIAGKKLESYRFKRGVVESKLQEALQALKAEGGKKISKEGYQDLFSPLVQRGYLRESSKTSTLNGYKVRALAFPAVTNSNQSSN